MLIYKIISDETKKVYVGQTIQPLNKRWIHHKWKAASGRNHPLYCAMRKYGIVHFRIEVLQELPDTSTQEELDAAEIHWISELKALAPEGLNIKAGGEGKFKMTLEHKMAISEAKKRQWAKVEMTDEIREKLRKASLGNKNRLGKEASEETKAKISAAQLGKVASEETKAKMSESHKKRLAKDSSRSPAQLEALAKAREKLKGKAPWNKGLKASEETRKKLSESHKGHIPWNKGKKTKA